MATAADPEPQAGMSERTALFRFSYDATFADYRALLRAKRALGPFGRHGRWLHYPVLAALFLATLWWLGGFSAPLRSYLNWTVALSVIGLIVFILLVDLFFDRVVGRWIYSRFAAADRPVTVSVDGEGVSWSVDAWSGRLAWSGMRNAVVTPDCVFLFIGKLEAVTLPRRGLVDGDWEAFLAFLEGKLPKPPLRLG